MTDKPMTREQAIDFLASRIVTPGAYGYGDVRAALDALTRGEEATAPAATGPSNHVCGGESRAWAIDQCGLCGDGPIENPRPAAAEPAEAGQVRRATFQALYFDGLVGRHELYVAASDYDAEVKRLTERAEKAERFADAADRHALACRNECGDLYSKLDALRERAEKAEADRDRLARKVESVKDWGRYFAALRDEHAT